MREAITGLVPPKRIARRNVGHEGQARREVADELAVEERHVMRVGVHGDVLADAREQRVARVHERLKGRIRVEQDAGRQLGIARRG
mgnify:CR=1 FL=1